MQVRTEEMHREAQFGIASHMAYKALGKEAERKSFLSFSFSWFRSLIPSLAKVSSKEADEIAKTHPHWLTELKDAHEVASASEEFVDGLKEDFFSHRMFVFTPASDVIGCGASTMPRSSP